MRTVEIPEKHRTFGVGDVVNSASDTDALFYVVAVEYGAGGREKRRVSKVAAVPYAEAGQFASHPDRYRLRPASHFVPCRYFTFYTRDELLKKLRKEMPKKGDLVLSAVDWTMSEVCKRVGVASEEVLMSLEHVLTE